MRVKDPRDTLDYGFNWIPWVGSGGDSITSSVFSVDGGCLVTSASVAVSSHTTLCYVSSGTAGGVARLTNLITTAQGKQAERSFELKIITL